MARTGLICGFVLLLATLAYASTPDRAQGISMHMLPKSVADLTGAKWGLTVRRSGLLTPDAGSTTLQTVPEFLAFVQKQNSSVRENGVWIVVTNPDSYTKPETSFLDEVIAVCKKEKIPLFISRAAQLPNGWKRYDQPD